MEREALKLALEVLKSDYTFVWPAMHRPEKTEKKRDDAIAAIKAALAQPKQEPVCDKDPQGCWNVRCQLGKQCKNLSQPAQEPVGWADLQKKAQQIVESKFLWKRFIDGTPLANDIACWMADFARQYTTPPQREWVGLTDEEIDHQAKKDDHGAYFALGALWAGAKLKEKNT